MLKRVYRLRFPDLTDTEVRALYYCAHQPHLIKGHLKTALRRAGYKVEEELCRRRRRAIIAAGVRAGKSNVEHPEPVFKGKRLGSIESMRFWDGVKDARPDFQHPMRD